MLTRAEKINAVVCCLFLAAMSSLPAHAIEEHKDGSVTFTHEEIKAVKELVQEQNRKIVEQNKQITNLIAEMKAQENCVRHMVDNNHPVLGCFQVNTGNGRPLYNTER